MNRAKTVEEIVSILKDGPVEHLDQLTDGVLVLRSRVELPSIDAGPREVIEILQRVRAALDQIEERLTIAVRFRSRIRDAHKIAEGEHDDAWAQATGSAAQKGRGASGWGEPAPRERYAASDLATLDLRRQVRKFERYLSQANDTVEIISRAYRSLDEIRKDLHLILRAQNVEDRLER